MQPLPNDSGITDREDKSGEAISFRTTKAGSFYSTHTLGRLHTRIIAIKPQTQYIFTPKSCRRVSLMCLSHLFEQQVVIAWRSYSHNVATKKN